MPNKTSLLISLVLLCVLASAAFSQTTIRTTEYGFSDNPPDTDVMVTTSGDSLETERYYFHITSDSPIWPSAIETCVSTVLVRNGSNVLSSGSCIRSDQDGDHMNGTWWILPNEPGKGFLNYFPGTGKYANLSCKGTWASSAAASIMNGRWTGHSVLTCTEMTND